MILHPLFRGGLVGFPCPGSIENGISCSAEHPHWKGLDSFSELRTCARRRQLTLSLLPSLPFRRALLHKGGHALLEIFAHVALGDEIVAARSLCGKPA